MLHKSFCCINFYAHATPLSAQIAEWYVHKDLCNIRARRPLAPSSRPLVSRGTSFDTPSPARLAAPSRPRALCGRAGAGGCIRISATRACVLLRPHTPPRLPAPPPLTPPCAARAPLRRSEARRCLASAQRGEALPRFARRASRQGPASRRYTHAHLLHFEIDEGRLFLTARLRGAYEPAAVYRGGMRRLGLGNAAVAAVYQGARRRGKPEVALPRRRARLRGDGDEQTEARGAGGLLGSVH